MTTDKLDQLKFIITSILGLILTGLLIFYSQTILTPILIYFLIFLLYSFYKSNDVLRILFFVTTFIFVVWVIHELLSILIPFIVAFLFAYILNPLVTFLHKKKLPRWLGALFSVLIVIIFMSLVLLIIVPPFIEQISLLINSAPDLIIKLQEFFEQEVLSRIKKVGFIYPEFEKFISIELPQRFQNLMNSFLKGVFGLIIGAGSILSQIINIIMIPILTFYFLKDFGSILFYIKNLFSKNYQEKILNFSNRFDFILGSYIRGFLVIAFINFIVITTGLTLIGVKYSVVLGLISALICFIPYFGILIGFLIGFIISALSGVSGFNLFLIPVLYFGENLLENMIFVPKVIGSRVGLHPIVILISLFVFGYFLGIAGMLIAVPITAFLVSFIKGDS